MVKESFGDEFAKSVSSASPPLILSYYLRGQPDVNKAVSSSKSIEFIELRLLANGFTE